jgi:hypothetical protein
MTAPALTDIVVRRSCRACGYAGCPECKGRGFMLLDPYRDGGGEQGDDEFGVREAVGRTVSHCVPVARWHRMVALARVLRDPTNSAPLRELLDLIEAGHG